MDNKSAMLYSLNALTSYGHEELRLAPHWKMMGALEALNGWILFGLTTASLFTVVQRVWQHAQAEAKSWLSRISNEAGRCQEVFSSFLPL
jgi:hypothetical protein